jgi:hypothetical protein
VYCIEEMYKFDALPAVGQTIQLSSCSIGPHETTEVLRDPVLLLCKQAMRVLDVRSSHRCRYGGTKGST